MELAGRVALITGGGTGLGRAIVLALADRGVHVAVNYSRSEAEAEQTALEARRRGVRAIAPRADVSVETAVQEMVARINAEFGRLDLLVCNAGTTRYAPLPELDAIGETDWDRILAVNVKGAFFCARVAASALRQARGSVLIVSSNSGLVPEGSSIPYIVSKAMLITLTQCLAAALAPEVRVNALAPGFMETRWLEQVFPPDVHRRIVEQPLVPLAGIDDVALAGITLLENGSITGQTLVVDNGEVMH